MRALVTGALGFVGTHLRQHLASEGDDVFGIDRDEGDITQPEIIDRLVGTHKPEVIYHLAGAADVGASWRDPVGTWDVNATATLHLLEAARTHGVGRVLIVSSSDVYGMVDAGDLPLDEASPVRPASPYAASKLAAEHLGRQAWLGHGFETILVRAFNHIGPGQRPEFVASALATRIATNELTGETEVPVGNLSARRDFTDVRDVASAYRLLAASGTPGETYCVCSGTDVAIEDLAESLLSMTEVPMTLVNDAERQRPIDLPILRGDNSKLVQATGWTRRYEMRATLADILAECRHKAQSDLATTTRSQATGTTPSSRSTPA